MSIFKKKEQNLNLLIDKLNSLSLSYSQPNYELEKIRTEKNDLNNKKKEIEKKKPRTNERTQVFEGKNKKITIRSK